MIYARCALREWKGRRSSATFFEDVTRSPTGRASLKVFPALSQYKEAINIYKVEPTECGTPGGPSQPGFSNGWLLYLSPVFLRVVSSTVNSMKCLWGQNTVQQQQHGYPQIYRGQPKRQLKT